MRRVRDWMVQAEADLKAAEDLCRTGNYSWSCFVCHQAAEKALKAILEHLGTPTYGHNLIALASEVSSRHSIPKPVLDACRILNRYYIPTRYPNVFPSGAPVEMFNVEDAEEAIGLARGVVNHARKVTGFT